MIEKPFENWLPIPEYERLYEIDTFGNVKSLDRKVRNNNGFRVIKGKILKPKLDDKGYYKIGLTKDNKQKFYFIHRLVALTFIPNPNNYNQINHIDGNKENNCVDNLEWCDSSYNIKDMYRRRGKYDNDDNIIKKYKELKSCNKVAKLFNMTGENVRGILIRNNVERKNGGNND